MSNLPERYTYAVTRHLPQAQRKEVADELQTTIEDMAADRAKNGKPTEADYKAVLQELGHPHILAHKYTQTRQYLIGPKWFDAYKQLLVTLLSFVPIIVAIVASTANILAENQPIVPAILEGVGAGLGAIVHIGFWVTAVFAVLERTVKPEEMTTEWTPDQLPEVPKHQGRQISAIESGVAAGFLVLVGAWVALHPIINVKNGETLFNPELGSIWAILFFILIGFAILHDLWKLKVGNWTTPITVTSIILAVATIAYLLALVGTQQLINPEYFRAWGVTGSTEDISRIIGWSVGITTAAIVISEIAESIQAVIMNRRFKNKTVK